MSPVTNHDQPDDRPPTTPAWVTIDDAAARLDITVNAVRQRIKRGTLQGEKRGGAWYVSLETVTSGRTDQPPTDKTTDRPTTPTTAPDALIVQLQSEVAYLRSELTAAREQAAKERERADVLQREALQRLEVLTAGPVAQHDADTTGHDAPGSSVRADSRDHGVSEGEEIGPRHTSAWGRLWRILRGGMIGGNGNGPPAAT